MKNEMYIILTLIPLLAGCGDKKEAARGAMPVPEISVASPVVKDITLTKEYPGYLSSEKTVDLVARVNGTLQTIAYAPGSRVRKGQVLFVIEPTIYQDNVEQAEAELNTARANLEYAQNNYARMLEAVKSDAVSQIQVLQSKSNVATSQAAVSNAEAALNTARTNLGYCTVRAPFDGTVSRNQVDVGSYVGGSLQPVTLATIYKDDLLYTYFNITDNQWLAMLIALNQFLRFQGAGDCCVKPLKVQRQTFCDKKKELSQAEYFRLLEAARRNGDMRLHLAIQTICATGIRVSELAYITVEAARLGRAIASNKGKSRIILIPKELCRNLLDYARERGIQDGPIFVTRGGRTLNRSNIWNAMKRLCKSAQVGPEKVYPHNLRHLFARTFYKKEKDISRLADILGHENVNTTRIYVVSSGAEHREQLESLHLTVPYQAACQNQEQHNDTLCRSALD